MEDCGKYLSILTDTLKKQNDALESIYIITQRQESIAKTEPFDEDAFDETLTEKDILIARLNELDNGFVSVYERIRVELKDDVTPYKEEIAEIKELIRKITDLSMEIKALESRNRDKLVTCFSKKKQQYAKTQSGIDVASKYKKAMKSMNQGAGYGFEDGQ